MSGISKTYYLASNARKFAEAKKERKKPAKICKPVAVALDLCVFQFGWHFSFLADLRT